MPTIIFWKPYRVLTQFTPDDDGRATLADYIDVPHVYAAGRLDYDSEGLLLLTDDGDLNHQLIHPKYRHPRTYWAQVENIPDEAVLAQLRKGVVIKGYKTRPIEARLIAEPELPPRNPPIRYRAQIPTAWLELVLTEGKKRQVRRMTAAVGYPTLRLLRVAIGSLTLDSLTLGAWRELSPSEMKTLRTSIKNRR